MDLGNCRGKLNFPLLVLKLLKYQLNIALYFAN